MCSRAPAGGFGGSVSVSPAARRSAMIITVLAGPAAWAVRTMAPRLWGSSTRSSTTRELGGGRGAHNVGEFGVLLFGSESDDSLMGFGAGETVERAAVLEPDGRAGGAGEIDDTSLQTVASRRRGR